jgi:hypothetical protein
VGRIQRQDADSRVAATRQPETERCLLHQDEVAAADGAEENEQGVIHGWASNCEA